MSANAPPMSDARFAEALRELPLSSLHLKVLELRNNIAHLDFSNEQMRPFAEGTVAVLGATGNTHPEPDQDCAEAISENEDLIERLQVRISLVRAEVEGRGVGWAEFQSKEEADAAAAAATLQGMPNGVLTNGVAAHANGDSDLDTDPELRSAARHHAAWSDGTFTTGVVTNDEVIIRGFTNRVGGGHSNVPIDENQRPAMENFDAGRSAGMNGHTGVNGYAGVNDHTGMNGHAGVNGYGQGRGGTGGSYTDEQLRRLVAQQMRDMGVQATDEDHDEDDDSGLHL